MIIEKQNYVCYMFIDFLTSIMDITVKTNDQT